MSSDLSTDSDRTKEFIELHDQVQTSVHLLDSLESFLSTFQRDLSAVSGQISELQSRSNDIENRLKSRRKIEKPLSSLISDIAIPPAMARLILDSSVGEPWIETIEEFERKLEKGKTRSRVKAARDIGEVSEGLRIVAAGKIRLFFLALFKPILKSVTTNILVIQTSVILKYRPLYTFLQRQAPNVAHEIQRSYVGTARTYYETGFRRYARSLGWVKTRSTEVFEPIGSSSKPPPPEVDLQRLAYSRIEGPTVTLAYMADDRSHIEPIEAIFRSLLLVFMDNASGEYIFVKTFFAPETSVPSRDEDSGLLSPTSIMSPTERNSVSGSDFGGTRVSPTSISAALSAAKEEQQATDALWKQVFDPVLQYIQNFVNSVVEPVPPVIPLLTMIRLTEDVASEIEARSCPAAVTFIFGLRLNLWPVFQKAMSDHVESVKKLAAGNAGYFSRAAALTETTVLHVCQHFVILFNAFVALTQQAEETMIFSNLLRLRQELINLIQRYTNQISDATAKATSQSSIYESILQGLSKGNQFAAHPKSQQELAYWSNLEEEARRKIMSVQQRR
ncbi:Vps52-domain-containing protein [Mucidula mucida]|nr:Vps52-domain-containing protein [Mucidula mucida]